jgi:hypothetical protein
MYIDVKRTDYPRKEIKYRNGRVKVIEPWYNCRYLHNGHVLAEYDSRLDVISLNDDYMEYGDTKIKSSRKAWSEWCRKTPYEKAMSSCHKEEYEYLFSMLGIDKTSKLSEYMSAY